VLPGRRGVVHALRQARVAQAVGQARLLDQLVESRLHVVASRKLRAHHQSELHLGHVVASYPLTAHRSTATPQPGTGIAGTRTTDVAGIPSPNRPAMARNDASKSRKSV